MGNFFPNESQASRDVLMNQIKAMADQPVGNWINVSGDTMTGELNVPTLAATSTVSLTGPLTVTNALTGSTMALTGAASIVGNVRLGGQLNGTVIAMTSIASINAVNIYSTVATVNPLTVAFPAAALGGVTIAPITLIASTASQCFFDFRGAVISTASLALTAANVAGLVRVWFQGTAGNAAGWMPIFLDPIAL